MLKNDFAIRSKIAEAEGWSGEQFKELLGEKRARLGVFEGDETEGEMEAGQCSGLIKKILTVDELFKELTNEFNRAKEKLKNY